MKNEIKSFTQKKRFSNECVKKKKKKNRLVSSWFVDWSLGVGVGAVALARFAGRVRVASVRETAAMREVATKIIFYKNFRIFFVEMISKLS